MSLMPPRATVDRAIDRTRFALDTFPRLDYQPLPWLGKTQARRDAGVLSRWESIAGVLDDGRDVRSAVDVGCNVGFFAINLALRGVATVGIEREPKFHRSFQHAVDRLGLDDVALMVMDLSPTTLRLVPHVDCVLFLSVWHHMVRAGGLELGSEVLSALWERTASVLFFETGEDELDGSWRLPALVPTAEEHLAGYLAATCPGGVVRHLGRHDAFAPDGSRCERNLFAVERAGS